MTIAGSIFIGVVIVVAICLIAAGIWCCYDGEVGVGVALILGTVIVGGCIIAGICWWSFSTEAGKRAYKDQISDTEGGTNRIVRVYDVMGDLVEQYEGRFDVESDNENYILFDDEDGNRHMIYFGSATILIDEVE